LRAAESRAAEPRTTDLVETFGLPDAGSSASSTADSVFITAEDFVIHEAETGVSSKAEPRVTRKAEPRAPRKAEPRLTRKADRVTRKVEARVSRAVVSQGRSPRKASRAKRWTAATASTASLGLAMSLMFAFPANADPSTLSPATLKTITDSSGHTAAQILDVSADVTMPTVQRDNQIASALAGIVAEEGGADGESAATAISNALRYGGPRQAIIEDALTYLGDPYVLDGSTHAGIDCSGLVMVAYAQVGIRLGHLVSDQDAVATPITEAQALPGDVVIFNSDEHIGIYLGGGLLIQAPEPGTPVNIVPVWTVAHHFGRILPAGE
jgi:cell wall-associated NlpC family hydrolase